MREKVADSPPGGRRAAVFGLILLGLLFLLSCSQTPLPGQLIGLWVSDHERYTHCYLEIHPDRIIFGNQANMGDISTIQKVDVAQIGENQVVTIIHVDTQGTELSLKLVYAGQKDGSLWLENQPQVLWHRRTLPDALNS